MKKVWLFFLFVYAANAVCQQSFAPKGTEWYYGRTIFSSPGDSVIKNYDYIRLRSEKDTVVNGQSCNKIVLDRGSMPCISLNTMCLRQSNDTIYSYSDLTGFSPLYVFGAGKGDTWVVKYPTGDVSVTVDSVGALQALERSLKVQYVTYRTQINANPPYQIQHSSSIVEGIGDLEYLFRFVIHETPNCDEFGVVYTGLRCYINPLIGKYSTSSTPCDFVSAISNTKEHYIKQYATPYHSLKVVSSNDNISSVKLLNTEGRIVYEKSNIEGRSVEISSSISGLIISIVTLETGRIFVEKVIL